jgi:hypothetical protein
MSESGARHSVIVIGSGFGSTIAALAIAVHFKGTDRRVLMLQRARPPHRGVDLG